MEMMGYTNHDDHYYGEFTQEERDVVMEGNDDEEEEDEDIIAIHEHSYHDSILPRHPMALDDSRCFSLSQVSQTINNPSQQQPTTTEEELQQKRTRRRRGGGPQQSLFLSSQYNAAAAGASQRDLDTSSGFASLKTLLEQDLSLTMTQESKGTAATLGGNDDGGKIEEARSSQGNNGKVNEGQNDNRQDENTVLNQVVPENYSKGEQHLLLETEKENEIMAEVKTPKMATTSRDKENRVNLRQEHTCFDPGSHSYLVGNDPPLEYCRTNNPSDLDMSASMIQDASSTFVQERPRPTQNLNFSPMFPNHDFEDGEDDDFSKNSHDELAQWRPQKSQPTEMDREMQRQRERRKSKQGSKKQSPKLVEERPYKKHRQNTTSISDRNEPYVLLNQDNDVEPTQSLRRQLDRQREQTSHKKKNRSKSADPYQKPAHKHKSKSATSGRARSTSPKRVVGIVSSSPKHQRPIAMEKSETSLIGLRPSHWGTKKNARIDKTNINSNNKRSSGRDKEKEMQRKKLAAAAETKTYSKLLMPPPASVRKSPHQRSPTANITGTTVNTTMSTTFATSFRQDFLPSGINPTQTNNSTNGTEMDIEEDDAAFQDTQGSFGGNVNNSNSVYSLSRLAQAQQQHQVQRGRKGSTSGKIDKKGRLSSLLKEVRGEIHSDCTRFKSGQYPFPHKLNSRFDLFDPRNRAISYTDVTIFSHTAMPWKRDTTWTSRFSEASMMTALGYIHEHHVHVDRDVLASENATMAETPATKTGFAWVCLSKDTLDRQQSRNANGFQLRIYNASLLPCNAEEGAQSNMVDCQYIVLCTQLSELYPTGILPELQPALSDLLVKLEGGH